MADSPLDTAPNGDANRTPRWVKLFGIVLGVLIVAFVILHLTGHGMGDHTR